MRAIFECMFVFGVLAFLAVEGAVLAGLARRVGLLECKSRMEMRGKYGNH